MKPVLGRDRVRALDRRAEGEWAVPSLVLMENAARGASDAIEAHVLGGAVSGARVHVLAGTGNNGGDGFALARRMMTLGARPFVWSVGDASRRSPDCAAQARIYERLGGEGQALERVDGHFLARLGEASVLVDALVGTGLERPLDGVTLELAGELAMRRERVVSLDVPSGLCADTGRVLGAAVRASLTVTFAALKPGLLTGQGRAHTGELVVADIGVPLAFEGEPDCWLMTVDEALASIGPRAVDVHKYRAGHVVIFGGSDWTPGALRLAARGALRAGAGAVTVASLSSAALSHGDLDAELMLAAVDPARVHASVGEIARRATAVVVGPGLGRGALERQVVDAALSLPLPVVVDADALTMLAGALDAVSSSAPRVLLPHEGELARLLGTSAAEVSCSRLASAAVAARTSGAVVALKGAHTLVAAPDATPRVLDVVAPVLAAAGSGDVLAGAVAALVAAGTAPFEATLAAAALHGAAARTFGADRGVRASEIADAMARELGARVVTRGAAPVR